MTIERPVTDAAGRARCLLSVAVITRDEEANLARCLDSVKTLVTDIVVVDSGSRDGTVAVAERFGARCVVAAWRGYAAQKNLALESCREPWVLCLDADEVVSAQLALSIAALFEGDGPAAAGYEVSRRTWYLGDWIRHTWYPDWKLRLVRRDAARWRGEFVHERLEVGGPSARLAGDLLHYSYRDLAHHLEKSVTYAEASARAAEARGVRFRVWRLLLLPPGAALRQLVLRQGWRDGWRGWIIAGVTAFGVFAREAFLLERERGEKGSGLRLHM